MRVLETLQSSESAQAGGATSTSHEHKTRCHGAAVVHPARLEDSQLGGSACVGQQRRPAGLVREQATDTAGLIKVDLTVQSEHVQGFQKGTACTRHFKCALFVGSHSHY